ncbi:hypothetical protein M595_2936 [Lyngbya aestuarii BL J]|uniref:Uncharacterized protein n=1 Tax=Lyngbya aestuarii BL J TaxID=1348334 RepID=U7QGH6_9CYAN|nr:hypothetical protein M595_2936 [Lyngbya aestuarii BL J]
MGERVSNGQKTEVADLIDEGIDQSLNLLMGKSSFFLCSSAFYCTMVVLIDDQITDDFRAEI